VLNSRVITACVLASVVVAGLYLSTPPIVAVILSAFLLVGSWEWSGLVGWRSRAGRVAYTLLMAVFAGVIWQWNETPGVLAGLLTAALLWWIVAAVFVVAAQRQRLGTRISLAANGAAGCLVLLPAWSAIVWLLHNDTAMLLALFGLVWIADASAYFAGRRWGSRRLAAHVSPGKTWEGVAGGVIASGIFAAALSVSMVLSSEARIGFIIAALGAVVASIIGDLFESMVKRNRGVKDSGRILPGHGGVLDRIDGLVAAAPVFCAGLYFWVNRL
jgi:phosphatidate cytidylyltransferase